MRRPAKKKAAARKPAKRPARAKPVPQGGATLAERIVSAPFLVEAKAARARVAKWLAGLPGTPAKALKALLSAHPTVATLLQSLAESSPYLWELASGNPRRLLLLLARDPDPNLAALLAETGRAVAATDDEAEAMRLLRRMKAEAALLIALADIGGVWPVMRTTRALTDLADTAVDAAARFVLAEAARDGRLKLKDKTRPQDGSSYIVLAMGKMGAFELNYSSDIDLIVFYDPAAPAVPKDAAPAALFVRLTQKLVRLLQERTGDGYVFRIDLRLRPDPALDPDRHLDRGGGRLLRERGPELGARRHDQGARLRRRSRGRRGVPRRAFALRLAAQSRLRRASRTVHSIKRQIHAHRGHGEIAVDGPQHQARPRRHPRDRILRADPATNPGRAQSGPARP